MRKAEYITTLTFLLLNILIFSDMLYASDNGNNTDGHIILNLHWSEGEITLNSMNKFVGLTKRAGRKITTHPFFYNILSEDGETIEAGYFKIPRKLYYDYFDESTGELSGGQLQRDELDFVIRVPYSRNAKQIMFYKTDRGLHRQLMNSNMLLEEPDDYEILGSINF